MPFSSSSSVTIFSERDGRLLVRQHRILLWFLGILAFLLCWLLLTLLILVAQETLFGPLAQSGRNALPTIDPDSYAGRGVQLLIGHFNGNLPAERAANLSSEEVNANHFSPNPEAGADGRPVELTPEEEIRSERTFGINQFNLLASDLVPLNRSLPDVRRSQCHSGANQLPPVSKLPDTSVIIVFHNEAFSTLARTVTSVLNRSPSKLIRELILVDDFSTRKFLHQQLDEFMRSLPARTKLIRSTRRVGLIRARLMGAQEAEGEVLTFLDSHCECTRGWLEPLLARIQKERRAVVCPIIDVINDRSFAYQKGIELFRGGFNWNMQFRWYSVPTRIAYQRHQTDPTAPIPSPTMAGGLFSIERRFFEELGAYDADMDIWGGENLEMSFRVWQCGGRVEILPCSHVGHVFRHASPHEFPSSSSSSRVLNANLARVAEVWMDEWRHFFHKVAPQAKSMVSSLDVSERVELRRTLGCHNFNWFLQNVWSDHFLPGHQRHFGRFRHRSTGSCLLSRPSSAGKRHRLALGECTLGFDLWQFWVLAPYENEDGLRLMSDEHQCLSAVEEPGRRDNGQWRVQLRECGGHDMEFWQVNNNNRNFVHLKSGLCLDRSISSSSSLLQEAANGLLLLPNNKRAIDGKFAVNGIDNQSNEDLTKLPTLQRCKRGGAYSQAWEIIKVQWLVQAA